MPSLYYCYDPGVLSQDSLRASSQLVTTFVTQVLNRHSEESFEEGQVDNFFTAANPLDNPKRELTLNIVAKRTTKRLAAQAVIADELEKLIKDNIPSREEWVVKLLLTDQTWRRF